MYLEKWDFDFPKYKEIHNFQENKLCKIAVIHW